MENKIVELNNATEILQNYEDLPDIVNEIQNEIQMLKNNT